MNRKDKFWQKPKEQKEHTPDWTLSSTVSQVFGSSTNNYKHCLCHKENTKYSSLVLGESKVICDEYRRKTNKARMLWTLETVPVATKSQTLKHLFCWTRLLLMLVINCNHNNWISYVLQVRSIVYLITCDIQLCFSRCFTTSAYICSIF